MLSNAKTLDLLSWSIIHQDRVCESDLKTGITEGRKAIAMLDYILWSSNILAKIKRLNYSAIVQSYFLFSSHEI